MKLKLTLIFSLVWAYSIQAQTLTFEKMNLPIDTFWNGSDSVTYYAEEIGFASDDSFIAYCTYDTAFGGFWANGYAISTMTDDSTANFLNLYSAITGSGHQSDAYAVVNAGSNTNLVLQGLEAYMYSLTPRFISAYVTNTTYAYNSMLYGDQFAKKFGGASGDDPDYFFIRFYFLMDYDSNAYLVDSTDFYLADYRFEDNSLDYIVDDWVLVDLNDFPAYEYYGVSVQTKLFSSDNGMFGMNTPSFYCMDDMEIAFPGGTVEKAPERLNLSVTESSFLLQNVEGKVNVFDLSGNLIKQVDCSNQTAVIKTSELAAGIYIVEQSHNGISKTMKVFRW